MQAGCLWLGEVASNVITLMPDKAMDPNRKVVMPPITHAGVAAKKAPICRNSDIADQYGGPRPGHAGYPRHSNVWRVRSNKMTFVRHA